MSICTPARVRGDKVTRIFEKLDRLKKPVQKPRATPRAMENCSSAVLEGISLSYKAIVLCCNNAQEPEKRNID